ncbi:aminotransferase class IV [bacterium]|nr:aminotransferase class IV [bacterium]
MRTGVFTTFILKCNQNAAPGIPFLMRHFNRLAGDAQSIGLPTKLEGIAELTTNLRKLLATAQPEVNCDLRIKVILSPAGLEFTITPLNRRWQKPGGISLKVFNGTRPKANIKHSDLSVSEAASQAAAHAQAEEALLVDKHDLVREGAWSNIFWFDRTGTLYTNRKQALPGIIQSVIIEQTAAIDTEITLADLVNLASEVFITNAVELVVPVRQLLTESGCYNFLPGPLTRKIQELVHAQALIEEYLLET